MQIIEKRLEELTPYEKNPRKNEPAIGPVMQSIQNFGFKVPMVIDSKGVIVCGHTRFKAAQKLGLETVPCIIADEPKYVQTIINRWEEETGGHAEKI